MTLLIDLSTALESKVKAEAQKRNRTPEQVIADIVANAFEEDVVPSVAEVIARIKATSPDHTMVTAPKGSLADALRSGPTIPDFDLEAWHKDWSAAEEELKRINLLNDIIEGQV